MPSTPIKITIAIVLTPLCLALPARARERTATPPTTAQRAEARKLFLEGKKRFSLRQFRAALKLFSRAYEIAPLSGLLFNIGQCHRFLGDCKQAIFFYSGFVRENPGTPDARFVQRLVTKCRKQLAAVKEQEQRASALFAEGKKSLTLGEFAVAIKRFKAAYKVLPRPGYLFHLAEAYRGQKQFIQAIRFYRAYLNANPGTPTLKVVEAQILRCRRLHRKQLKAQGKPVPPPDGTPVRRPVYKRWWFWTTIAAGVAAALGLGLGLTLGRNSGDTTLPPHDYSLDLR